MRWVYFSGIIFATVFALNGCSEESGSGIGQTCPDGDLVNAVDASDWAESRAGIATYHYTADVVGGVAHIDLLDDTDQSLGSMRVRQLFGDDDEADGVMEAVLGDPDSASSLRLITQGEGIDGKGYTVQMRLEGSDGAPPLFMTARFKTVRCWLEDGPAVAPPCAAGLPLGSAAFTLPSCGLIVDERIGKHQPPELAELTYSVIAEDALGVPSVGGLQRFGAQQIHRLRVFDSAGVQDEAVVEQWIAETGADALVGTEAERLLTTAFLDRSWWRVLEQHVAHCEVEALPHPVEPEPEEEEVTESDEIDESESGDESESENTATQVMSLCPGNQNNNEWGSGNNGADADIWGDPHLNTFDGFSYDLQAAGEYVLFEAHAGEPLTVQGRFEPLGETVVPECGDLSWNTAAATVIAGKRVTARVYPEWEVRIDGELVEGPDDVPELDDGASIILDSDSVSMGWPEGEFVEFHRRRTRTPSLTVEATLPPHRRGQIRGLLGQFDGDRTTDLVLPNGTILEQPGSFEDLYEVLAPSWRVRKADSLFDYHDGEDADSFLIDGFPSAPIAIADLPEDLAAEAEETCLSEGVSDAHNLAACTLDVICFDDPGYAQAAADAQTPVASQPPGRHDLMVDGDIRHVEAPETVAAEALAEPVDCRPVATPPISIFDEHRGLTLEDDVDVNLTSSGSYDADSGLSSSSVSAGTEVASYQLLRRQSSHPGRVYAGTIRFAQPIIGITVDEAALIDSDEQLGAPGTVYESSGFQGLRSQNDVLVLGEDGRTLHVTWSGEEAQRVRVLTEVAQ